MERNFFDTDVVFGDLTHVVHELNKERSSPVQIRRLFSQFINFSQQITEVMRKEYKDASGCEWNAKSFYGWNDVTNLFKKLRRTHYHCYPATICVEETQYFGVAEIFENGVGTSEVAVQGTWELGDPFSELIPDGLQLVLADAETGKMSDKTITPRRRSYIFRLNARTPELDKAITLAGTNDVHQLVEKCFAALTEYYGFYKTKLSTLSGTGFATPSLNVFANTDI